MVNPYIFEGLGLNDNVSAAYLYADQGFKVLPIMPGSKRPPAEKGPEGGGYKLATQDDDQITRWWEDNPDYGVAIVPATAGLVCVDIDGPEGLADWREMGYDIDDLTPTVRTPGRTGGYHRYYQADEATLEAMGGPKVIGERGKVELIGNGKYVLAPPTIHPDGLPYKSMHTAKQFAALPKMLVDMIVERHYDATNWGVSDSNPDCPYCPAAAAYKVGDIGEAVVGQRNHMLFRKLAEILELPCLSDYGPWIDKAQTAYLGLSTPQAPVTAHEFAATLDQAKRRQQKKGGYGTGHCDNAIRVTAKEKRTSEGRSGRLIRASELRNKKRLMLFKQLIPQGALSILAGAPGKGKSSFLRWLAAEDTLGTLDNGTDTPTHGSVLWITAEESIEGAVRPALEAAGANLDYVFFQEFRGNELFEFVADDGGESLRTLLEDIRSYDVPPCNLVVIDSLELYMTSTDANNSREVKLGLKGMAEEAVRQDCSIVVVEHITKDSHRRALERVIGSTAKTAMSRAVLGWGMHPTNPGELILNLLKGSYASPYHTPAEVFRFDSKEVDVETESGLHELQTQFHISWLRSEKIPPAEIFTEQDYEDV